jgi:hypothetical protein
VLGKFHKPRDRQTQAKGKQQQVEGDGVDTTEKEKQPRTELFDCVIELLESKLNVE